MISPDTLSKIENLIGRYEYAVVDHNGKVYVSKIDVSGLGGELSSIANISHYMLDMLNDKFKGGEIAIKNGFLFFTTFDDIHLFIKLRDRAQKQNLQMLLLQVSDILKSGNNNQ